MPMIKDVADAKAAGCIRYFYYDNKTSKNIMMLMYNCYAINHEVYLLILLYFFFSFEDIVNFVVCITLNKTTLVSHGLSNKYIRVESRAYLLS
jgi:hypothetical protein